MRRSWRVPHPAGALDIVGPVGRGGPSKPTQPGRNPAPLPGPGDLAGSAAGTLAGPLTSFLQTGTRDLVGGGQVLLGAILIVAGLLLATGLAGQGARLGGRAALFAASRGALK